jgi:hypothetical protein
MMRTWVGFLLPKGYKMVWNYIALALGILAVYSYVSTALSAYRNRKIMELQFIIASVELLQLKFHSIQIVDLIYEKAKESDPKYEEEHKKTVEKIDEKFNEYGNYYIKRLASVFGEEFTHKSWKDAIKYAEEKMKK